MISSLSIALSAVSLVNKDGKKPDHVAAQLMTFIQKYGLQGQLPMILQHIRRESDKERKNKTLFIHTPFAVDETLEHSIKKLAAVPANTLTDTHIDRALLGGFVAYWQDTKIDASMSNTLRHLELALLS